jgi:hypothetical protein
MPETRTLVGYIVGLANPEMSGLAVVQVAEKPDARKTRMPGTVTTLAVEAGFGVRQIVRLFGSWDALVERGPTTLLVFNLDGILITSVEPVEG